MKRLAIFILILFIPLSVAQSYVKEWDDIYDMPGLDAGEEGRSVCIGNETIAVAIISFSFQDEYRGECILTHYDTDGAKQLEKVIPLYFWNENERNVAVCFLNETAIVAYTYRNIHIMAYAKNGSEIWEKQWGKEASVNDIAIDVHGNIYVIGSIYGDKETELCILKYKRDGGLDWNISLDGRGMGIDVTKNAIFAVGCKENQTFLLKINFSGNIVWERTYAIDKGCDVVGGDEITVAGENNESIVVFRCDKNGNVIWLVRYEEESVAHSIDIDEKGNVFIAGGGYNKSSHDYDFLILEYNPNGELIRKIQYNGEGSRHDEAWDVDVNKRIIATGFVTTKKIVSPPQGIAFDRDAYTAQYYLQNIPPIADFSWEPEEPTAGKKVKFFDESSDIDGKIRKWRWNFGDKKTSYQQNPTHVYAKEGKYLVNLTVTDDEGGKHWIVKEITVHGKKTPGFEMMPLLLTIIIIFIKRRRLR